MKRTLVPSFVVVVASTACGGTPSDGPTPPETPIATNPPAPDGSPGIGDGAGPPPDAEDADDADE